MATLTTKALSQNDDHVLIALFDAYLEHDCGDAARAHLHAGRPIHYVEQTTHEGHFIREHPDGSRELLQVDADGSTHVTSSI